MPKLKRINYFLILLMLVVSACDSPPDKPFCRKLDYKETKILDDFGLVKQIIIEPNPKCMKMVKENECAYCVWFVSEKDKYVGSKEPNLLDGQTWAQLLEGAILVPLDTFTSFKAYVRTQCKKTNCDKQIPRWRVKFNQLEEKK